MVGKLLLDHRISQEVIRLNMLKLWKVDSKFKVREIGQNTFIFSFTSLEEKDKARP